MYGTQLDSVVKATAAANKCLDIIDQLRRPSTGHDCRQGLQSISDLRPAIDNLSKELDRTGKHFAEAVSTPPTLVPKHVTSWHQAALYYAGLILDDQLRDPNLPPHAPFGLQRVDSEHGRPISRIGEILYDSSPTLYWLDTGLLREQIKQESLTAREAIQVEVAAHAVRSPKSGEAVESLEMQSAAVEQMGGVAPTGRDSNGSPAPISASADSGGSRDGRSKTDSEYAMSREGDTWRITYGDERGTVKDGRGAKHVAKLLQSPGTELPAVMLHGGTEAELKINDYSLGTTGQSRPVDRD